MLVDVWFVHLSNPTPYLVTCYCSQHTIIHHLTLTGLYCSISPDTTIHTVSN